jgi:TolA-binding protein
MRRFFWMAFLLPSFVALGRFGVAQDLPSSFQATLDTAIARYDSKQYDEALPQLQQLADSKAPDALRARALAYVAFCQVGKGDRVSAKSTYETILNRFPADQHACRALLGLGNLAGLEKDYPNALLSYERAANDFAHSTGARAWAAEAQCRVGSCRLGYHDPAFGGKRDLAKALEAFQRVVDRYPDQSDWVAEARMQLVALEMEYALNHRVLFSEAQKSADAFLTTYPTDTKRIPTVHMIRAEALFHQDKFDDAITEIRLIQSQYSDSGQPAGTSQFLLGQCYDRKGDYERAIAEYRKFVDAVKVSFSAWEERPGALYGIFTCERILGHRTGALAVVEELKRDYPKSYFVALVTPLSAGPAVE